MTKSWKKLVSNPPKDIAGPNAAETVGMARKIAEAMIRNGEIDPV